MQLIDIEESRAPLGKATICLCSDSTYSIQIIRYLSISKSNRDLAHAVREIANRRNDSNRVTANWVAGHAHIALNEHADFLAKAASNRSSKGFGFSAEQRNTRLTNRNFVDKHAAYAHLPSLDPQPRPERPPDPT